MLYAGTSVPKTIGHFCLESLRSYSTQLSSNVSAKLSLTGWLHRWLHRQLLLRMSSTLGKCHTFSKGSCWITQVRNLLQTQGIGGSCVVRFSSSQLSCWKLYVTSWRLSSTKWSNNRTRPTGCLIPPWMVCTGHMHNEVLMKILVGNYRDPKLYIIYPTLKTLVLGVCHSWISFRTSTGMER